MLSVRRVVPNFSAHLVTRPLHSVAAVRFPRRDRPGTRYVNEFEEDIDPSIPGLGEYTLDDMPTFAEDDASVAGHIMIEQKKQILKYMRLIERDHSRLQQFRRPFVPPSDQLPLIVRSISYSGEEHPATRKQIIVVAVSLLRMNSPEAIHKVKLLAGPRWSQEPPRDSGVGRSEHERIGEHGYIKISCEDFPEPAMNLKWGSDVVDSLIKEANNMDDSFADIPHDRRHLVARVRKHRKGDHLRNGQGHRPTIKDFPKEWLPKSSRSHAESEIT